MSRRIVMGPFNRVEGDLEVRLEMEGNRVASAQVNSTLFRGFEAMLAGRKPSDILVYAPRICGICSVSQSVAAAAALADAYGIKSTHNGQLATNIMLANENAADLLTHFYLFFMPDFARPIYQNQPWFGQMEQRFKAMQGDVMSSMMQARAGWLKMMGILAGRWPHSLAIQPGGSSRAVTDAEAVQLLMYARQFRMFIQQHLLGDEIKALLSLNSVAEFETWLEKPSVAQSDLGLFCQVAKQLELEKLGVTDGRLMSYGNYPNVDGGRRQFGSGTYFQGQFHDLNPTQVTEDLSHAHYQQPRGLAALTPWQDNPMPELDKPEAYSWCKAPRLNGEVMEVGALARQVMSQQPLILDMMQTYGSSVFTRVLARSLEMTRIVTLVEEWLTQFESKAPFCNQAKSPNSAKGIGLVEAARGSLGHWVHIEKGVIQNFQVIAPTTWNFSPRDEQGVPGCLEKALVGIEKREGEDEPVAVQHVVRSFDPCMVCTVH